MSDRPPLPSEEEWTRASQAGERLVRKHFPDLLLRRLDRGAHALDSMAVLLGALTTVCDMLYRLSDPNPEAKEAFEVVALYYARGALRGLETPVFEDGTPYEAYPET
jgi:hypothetical protein